MIDDRADLVNYNESNNFERRKGHENISGLANIEERTAFRFFDNHGNHGDIFAGDGDESAPVISNDLEPSGRNGTIEIGDDPIELSKKSPNS